MRHIYNLFLIYFFKCAFAILIFFSEASIPVTFAPNLDIGSAINPPPQPISKIFNLDKGKIFFSILKCLIMFSLMYFILKGLKACKGLNFPSGFHHSSAILKIYLFLLYL